MFIAFLPRTEARDLIEVEYEADAQRSEMEADLGSSFFFGGATSGDAMFLAREHLEGLREDFEQSVEGELYSAKLEAARFITEAITPDMHIADFADFDGFATQPWGATVIPEYRLDYKRSMPIPADNPPF